MKSILLAASTAFLFSSSAGFAEDVPPAAKFSTAVDASAFDVEYEPILQFTNAFGLEQGGRMQISFAAVEQQGEEFLQSYLGYLAGLPVSRLSRNDQLAFWLNTRNMLVVDAMSKSRARRRMTRARGTPEAPGEMWTAKRITVEGIELSIHDIEQNIILANFSDKPNVTFGLYQGTVGSPAFPAKGFSTANLDAELAEAGRNYVNSRKNGVKFSRKKAELPAIYAWYMTDLFGDDETAARAHLASLLEGDKATRFNEATQFKTRKFSYSSDELIIRQQPVFTTGDDDVRGFFDDDNFESNDFGDDDNDGS